jgi:hypothetical protein
MLQYRPMFFATLFLIGAIGPLAAQQSGSTKVGVLTCKTSASLGLIVGSHQKLRCSFSPDGGGPPESYVGHVNRLGLDLGIKAGGAMAWGVFAPTNGLHHGALAGTYVGASGSASLGVGAGANALVGGRIAPLRYSHSRSKGRVASILPSVSPGSRFGPPLNLAARIIHTSKGSH